MKAMLYHESGGPEVLRYVDVADPEPGPRDVVADHTIDIEDAAYDIVVLGHVCRTEGADGARHLIERAFRTLKPQGRLLLAVVMT